MIQSQTSLENVAIELQPIVLADQSQGRMSPVLLLSNANKLVFCAPRGKATIFFYCVPPTATQIRNIFVEENPAVSNFGRENMPESCTESREVRDVSSRRKKARFGPSKIWQATSTPNQRTLELEGVIEVLKEYDSCDGNDINCSICGKSLYFSCVRVACPDIRTRSVAC